LEQGGANGGSGRLQVGGQPRLETPYALQGSPGGLVLALGRGRQRALDPVLDGGPDLPAQLVDHRFPLATQDGGIDLLFSFFGLRGR